VGGRQVNSRGLEDSKWVSGGSLNVQAAPVSAGRGAEATLQQLEADFAKLRSELRGTESHVVEGKFSSANPSVQIPAPSLPWSSSFATDARPTQSSGPAEGGASHLWSRPFARPGDGVPGGLSRTETQHKSQSAAPDLEAWRDLWGRSSQPQHRSDLISHQHSRGSGDVSRLYDELMRLEEEEASVRRLADLGEMSKSDRSVQGRRRVSSCSNLTMRKARPR